MNAPTLALDVGGTKIAAGIVDANGQLLQQNLVAVMEGKN